MSVSQTFRSLAFYDILTNLVPGIVVLFAFVVLVSPVELFGELPVGVATAGFLVVAYIAGHVTQALGSWFDNPTTFGETVASVQSGEYDDSPITITHVEKEFWSSCVDVFDIPNPNEFENYGRLLELVLSHLETTPYTRALRFQALHSFHRSMWATTWVITVAVPVAGGLHYLGVITLYSTVIAGGIFVFSVIGILVFNRRKTEFDKVFIKYAIADFYESQAIATNGD